MAREKKDSGEASDDSLWYKDAILYELHVKAFYDSNSDGIGDFPGLTAKLDYLQDLGVNTLWLLPFYPSPLKDDGYDIADYRRVHPDYGTRRDFRNFVREAHRRGLRVVTELVINHTSDQHPWFQAARRAPRGSVKRDYYVWSDTDQKYLDARIIFVDTEKSNWAWDAVAQQYYWHRFFSHQPDLNYDNPHVAKAIARVMNFWMDLGVDGMRLDAIPYLCERQGSNCENLPETHIVLKQLRGELDRRHRNRMFLAEANQWPEDVRDYFGEGDECHMAYHFPLMPRMYMAIAQEDRHPIVEIMQQTPDIPEACQWAVFLRNHDELTLEMVTSRERDYLWQTYAADPRARLNLGIRRRLAPLLDNDLDKMRLMNSLLLSMPGSPIIYYGDEIGMGDNIYLGDRNGVRTPMQWSPDRNAGFSRADPQRLYLPPIMDPVYGYEAVNVEAQSRDPSSMLNWMKRLLAVRKNHQAFGRGRLVFLRPGNRKVLAYVREHGEDTMLCVANLSRSAQPVELDLSRYKGRVPVELLGRAAFPPIGELPYLLSLPGHGFYWFRLAKGEEVPGWHEERLVPEDLPVLVLFDGWHSLFRERAVPWRIAMAERVRAQLEDEALPRFLVAQRWYAAKDERMGRVRLVDQAEWRAGRGDWLVAVVDVELETSGVHRYFLPLSLLWEDDDEERVRAVGPGTVARVRQQARVGVLADGFADEAFCRSVVQAIGQGLELPTGEGQLRFVPTRAYGELVDTDPNALPLRIGAQGSNSAISLGHSLFLKGYRRLQTGVNPEIEFGRFLTEVVRFPNAVPLAGFFEHRAADGTVTTLGLLQGYIDNEGDGWTYTLEYLERFLDQARTNGALQGPALEVHAVYLTLAHALGRRTAELHLALATQTGDAAFDPEGVTTEDLDAWAVRIQGESDATFDLLAERLAPLRPDVRAEAEGLLVRRDVLRERISVLRSSTFAGLKTRFHGDYHLGQVLVHHNDIIIIDFEGEPARPLAERREKNSPLRDLAGMLRSFDYAAHAAVRRVTAERPDDYGTLVPYAQTWRVEAERMFLEAYEGGVRGSRLYPDWAQARGLLDLFLIEKALYEIRYELHQRPDWLPIPLRGLWDLVRTG